MKLSRDLAAALLATAAFCMVVGLGFWKTRGPAAQRLIHADETRIRSMSQLANQVNNYYNQHNKQLPASLDEEQKRSFRDPITQRSFEYTVKSETSYSLCADFSAASPADYQDPPYDFWQHAAGHKCFDFEAGGQVAAAPYFYY
jgi:uncharacterized membrane protein YhiD involved in acid resistance